MKKLMICTLVLLLACLCFFAVTANWESPAERGSDSVTPVEEYTMEYVLCGAAYTEYVMDYRDKYGVKSVSDYEPTVYDATSETLTEDFSQLVFDENMTKPQYIDAIYEALEKYLPEELVFSDFMVAAESTVVTLGAEKRFAGFVSYADHVEASEISYRFSFTLAIGMVPSEASATVEIEKGRVTKVTVDDMERFLPYLNLTFDREHLESLVNSADSSWERYSAAYEVTRQAALATSDDALYLVINTQITDHVYDQENEEEIQSEERYVFDSAYGDDVYEIQYVYEKPSIKQVRAYYVKLATLR